MKEKDFNNSDIFVIGENYQNIRAKHHLRRVDWLGYSGKTYEEIKSPNSEYLNQPSKHKPYSHIKYDLKQGYIKKINRSYWWVNQGQTYKEEINGGYMWSPKTNKNGAKNHFYENMRTVLPGDFIFSYYNGKIQNIGIATSGVLDESKPNELEHITDWNANGWMVKVDYSPLEPPIVIKDIFNQIKLMLPSKYSPLNSNGTAYQGYLFKLGDDLANFLIDSKKNDLSRSFNLINDSINSNEDNSNIDFGIDYEKETTKQQLVKSRLGQGQFRKNVAMIEKSCRVTNISEIKHLRASHIKPWMTPGITNLERLDGYNGLFLAPHIDHLFDKGYISFKDDGDLILSKALSKEIIKFWGINYNFIKKPFHKKHLKYLKFHRKEIFKGN